MTVFEIDEQFKALQGLLEDGFESLVDEETGEVIDIASELDKLAGDRDTKVANICMMIKNLSADIKPMQETIKRIQEAKKAKENRIESLKKYLTLILKGEKAKDPKGRFSVYYKSSQSVNVFDEAALPKEFWVPQDPTINKIAISKVLKAGGEVPGAKLDSNTSTIIK